MKTNYHTHLMLCGHATGMSEDYIKVAIEEGYDVLGIQEEVSEGKCIASGKDAKYIALIAKTY